VKAYSHAAEFSAIPRAHAPELIAFLDEVTARNERSKRRTYDALALEPGMSVLDVGCGTGDDVRRLYAIVGPSGRAAGVDFSEEMVEEARARAGDLPVQFLAADAQSLPFADCEFDALRAERTLQHVAKPAAAIAEFYRVLKPGGRAAIIDQDWETFVVAGADKQLTRKILNHFTDSFANGWAGRNTGALLRRQGFDGVDVVTQGGFMEFEFAYKMLLRQGAMNAAAAGAVSQHDAEAWLAELQQSAARQEFLAFATTFFVTAVKRT